MQIEEDTLRRGSGALACKRFKGEHSYLKIAENLDDIMSNFNIPISKVVSTVTDNGSNFVKAFKEFGVDARSTINQTDLDPEINDGNEDEEEVEIDDLVPLNLNDLDDTNEHHAELDYSLSKQVRCASHTLSLVATTDAKKALKTSSFSSINHTTMGKCSSLWNKSGRPKSAEIIKEVIGCQLRLPCVTRWNSLYDSLVLLMKHKDKLHKLMSDLGLPPFKTFEIEFIVEYIEVLAPIATAIDRLQGEKESYFGELLPTLLSVDKKLDNLNTKSVKHCRPLITAIHTGFKKRFGHMIELVNEPIVHEAIIASTTHPYFKLRWLTINDKWNQEEKKCLVKKIVLRRIAEISSITSTANPPSASEDDDDFFSFEKCSEDASSVTSNSLEMQLINYLNDKDKSLQSIDNYPAIKKLFHSTNTTIPSSAPVERLFSFAGMTLTPKRSSMSDKTFERLILIKSNN